MPNLTTLEILWRGLAPTLLKHDGTEFPGGTVIKSLLYDYEKKFPEVITYADNSRGFSELGDSQGWMDGFMLEAFSQAAYRQIKENIANELSQGVFVLEIPELAGGTSRHAIRFYDWPAERLYPRREGFYEVFAGTVTEVDVLT